MNTPISSLRGSWQQRTIYGVGLPLPPLLRPPYWVCRVLQSLAVLGRSARSVTPVAADGAAGGFAYA